MLKVPLSFGSRTHDKMRHVADLVIKKVIGQKYHLHEKLGHTLYLAMEKVKGGSRTEGK